MTMVQFNIEKCDKCPFVKTKLTKGFGYALDYMCSKKDNRVITSYIEWDSQIPPVPEWCPIKVNDPPISTEFDNFDPWTIE